MGAAASSARDNDDLVDELVEANILFTHRIETALRLVDRRRFFPKEGRLYAYRNLPWRSKTASPGFIHISAPRIYAKALECLDLMKGNKFLNVGSGTGYLNTVAGYLLGSTGANHGIEIHQSVVQYARELVEETLKRPETQCFDWAVPEFTCGNGLFLSPDHYGKYDRVYCGAAVPPTHRRALWRLLKTGGILVMPYDDQFQQVRRRAANVFEVNIFSSVLFSSFILPTEEETSKILYSNAPPLIAVPTLQHICATFIRQRVRTVLLATHTIHIRDCVNQQPRRTHDDIAIIAYRDDRPFPETPHVPDQETFTIMGPGLPERLDNQEGEDSDDEQQPERSQEQSTQSHEGAHIGNMTAQRSSSFTSESGTSSGTSQDPAGTSSDGSSRTENSENCFHLELEDESSSAEQRNDDDSGSGTDEELEDDIGDAKMNVVEGGATAETKEEEEILRYDNAVSSSSIEVLPQRNEQDEGNIAEEQWHYSAARDESGNSFLSSAIDIEQAANDRRARNVYDATSYDDVDENIVEDYTSPLHRSDTLPCGVSIRYLETDEKISREQARLEECERQRRDIEEFALLFERRLMELPLNEALKNYIKYLSK